MELATNTCNIV